MIRSTDSGVTWQAIYGGLPERFFPYMISISYGSNGDRRLFMTTDDEVFYSDDLGENWSPCPGNLPRGMNFALIDVSPVNQDLVFLGGLANNNSFFRSSDRGVSWHPLSGLPYGFGSIQLYCDPLDENVLYASLGVGLGVYKSINQGESWTAINNNLPRDDFFFTDGLAINPYNNNEIYVYSYHKGVFVSYDSGNSWSNFNNGLYPYFDGASTLIDPADTNQIYLASDGHSFWSYTKSVTSITDPPAPHFLAVNMSTYPNPFNAQTKISYNIPLAGNVRLSIYNLLGQHITTLFDGMQSAGAHSQNWDATACPSGLYFARLSTANEVQNIKMMLMK